MISGITLDVLIALVICLAAVGLGYTAGTIQVRNAAARVWRAAHEKEEVGNQ